MRGQNVFGAGLAGRVAEQLITGMPRGLLDAGLRLFPPPAQRAVFDLEPFGELLDGERLARRFLAQTMVDRDGEQLWPALEAFTPARREPQQGRRVRTARYGEDERGLRARRHSTAPPLHLPKWDRRRARTPSSLIVRTRTSH
jgi:hypothetical protein